MSSTEPLRQVVLLALSLAVVLPLLFVVVTALKTPAQWIVDSRTLVPDPPTLENFEAFFSATDTPRLFRNSLVIVVGSVVGTLVSCSIVAYPLARIRFRGREAVFIMVIASMMLPPVSLLIPQYLLFVTLGWIDTPLPLIVPNFFGVGAFFIFFLRQSFRMIPRELDEAVLVDGGTYWTAFRRVVLPLSKGPLVTVAVLQAVGTYNDFFGPLIYLHSPENFTVPIGIILAAQQLSFISATPVLMAGTLVLVVPIVVFFVATNRALIEGIRLTGGVKG